MVLFDGVICRQYKGLHVSSRGEKAPIKPIDARIRGVHIDIDITGLLGIKFVISCFLCIRIRIRECRTFLLTKNAIGGTLQLSKTFRSPDRHIFIFDLWRVKRPVGMSRPALNILIDKSNHERVMSYVYPVILFESGTTNPNLLRNTQWHEGLNHRPQPQIFENKPLMRKKKFASEETATSCLNQIIVLQRRITGVFIPYRKHSVVSWQQSGGSLDGWMISYSSLRKS